MTRRRGNMSAAFDEHARQEHEDEATSQTPTAEPAAEPVTAAPATGPAVPAPAPDEVEAERLAGRSP